MNINWDAKGYKENFSFVHEYGEDVISLLKSPKGSAVLDLGCGNGALSAILHWKRLHPLAPQDESCMHRHAKMSSADIVLLQFQASTLTHPFQLPYSLFPKVLHLTLHFHNLNLHLAVMWKSDIINKRGGRHKKTKKYKKRGVP